MRQRTHSLNARTFGRSVDSPVICCCSAAHLHTEELTASSQVALSTCMLGPKAAVHAPRVHRASCAASHCTCRCSGDGSPHPLGHASNLQHIEASDVGYMAGSLSSASCEWPSEKHQDVQAE